MANEKRKYWHFGDPEKCALEYKFFQRCLPQLIDPDSLEGDLTGKWVIFVNGWVLPGAYDSQREAADFAYHMHKVDQQGEGFSKTHYIIVQVGLEHAQSALHLLGAAFADNEFDDDPQDG